MGCLLRFGCDGPPTSGQPGRFVPTVSGATHHHVPESRQRLLDLRPLPLVKRETLPGAHQFTGYLPPSCDIRRLAGIGSEFVLPNVAVWSNFNGSHRSKVSKLGRAMFSSSPPLYGTCYDQPAGCHRRSFLMSFKTSPTTPKTRRRSSH